MKRTNEWMKVRHAIVQLQLHDRRTDGRTSGLTDDKNTKHCHLNDIQRRNDNNCVAFARTTRGSTKRQDMIRHDKTRHSMPSYTSAKEAVVSARVIQQIMSHKTNFHGKQIIVRKNVSQEDIAATPKGDERGVKRATETHTQKRHKAIWNTNKTSVHSVHIYVQVHNHDNTIEKTDYTMRTKQWKKNNTTGDLEQKERRICRKWG